MSITKIVKSVLIYIYQLLLTYRNYSDKQRSERALARLDARLLDDVGLARDHQDHVVPLKDSVHHDNSVRDQRSKARLRHAYFLRRRRHLRNLRDESL